MLHDINVSDPVLTSPSGYNVCLRVGGLDVKIDSFKISFHRAGKRFYLGWLRTLVFKDHEGVCLVQVVVGLVP